MIELLYARRLRQLLFILIVVLTFEGIVRKATPPGYSTPLFLLKDGIVVVMAFYVLQMPPAPALTFLWNGYKILTILFVPLIIFTGWNDPLLAIFGAKQYLLFPMVGFATFLAFQNSKIEKILAFFRWIALLLVPTALLAFLQLRLPSDHWLNMSVSHESLEGFSAGGELRVSSTFSFVAQYCAFLNAQAFIFVIALQGWPKQNWFWKIASLSLIPLLVLSSFITGSRGAVAGNLAIFLLSLMLALIKLQFRTVVRIGAVMAGLYLMVHIVTHYFPETTAAYSARENGHLIGFSSEVRGRVLGSYFDVEPDPDLMTYFGNGLGVMSNGSSTFSPYAAEWRARKWMETDFSSTLFEGGYYLAIIWYGFRLYVILVTTHRFLKDVSVAYTVPAAFTQAFVLLIGVLGTLAIQPPVAVWWWTGVGASLLFWWKCVGPSETDLKLMDNPLPPKKAVRGRSLYAEVLHDPKA